MLDCEKLLNMDCENYSFPVCADGMMFANMCFVHQARCRDEDTNYKIEPCKYKQHLSARASSDKPSKDKILDDYAKHFPTN